MICLVACNNQKPQDPTPEHIHSFGEWSVAKNATCTEDGLKTRYCDCGEKQSDGIPLKGHTRVVLEATSATCITEGKTEGEKCSDCGEILVEQTKIDALGHKDVVDAGTDATCTSNGLTEGKHCSRCDEIIVAQTVIDAKGHTVVVDEAVAPSCTKTGLTEGKHCSVCNEILVKQGIEPVIAHRYDDKYDDSCNVCGGIRDTECAHREIEVIPGYASTCTDPGLTQGQKCKKCGEVITHQTVINAKGHTEVIDEAISATCTNTGLTAGKHCSTCDKVLVEQGIVPTLPHTYSEWVVTKTANCGQDGEMTRSCTCGAKQTEVIYGAGMHGEIIDPAVEPTCTTTGLTEGKHCSYCGTVLVQQEVVPTLEHVYNTTYSFDNSFHWYACKGCGTAKDKEEHQLDDGGLCSVCDQPIGSTIGIIYDKSADGTYAEVVGYEGTAKKIRIADTYEGLPVKTIYNNAFQNKTITSVIIPDSVTSVGNSAFYNCSSLTSLVIGDSVTDIGEEAFYCCYSLNSVIIPDSVINIGKEAFQGCSSLNSVIIGNGVTSIGDRAFRSCTKLNSVVIGNSVTRIGSEAFYGCHALLYTEYEYGKYIASGDNSYAVLIGITNKNLSSYTIHGDTKTIAYGVFESCSRLTSIIIPDGVTGVGDKSFHNCTSLSSITIPNSVTSIGNSAFVGCDGFSTITIPNSVTSIGNSAFAGCDGFSTITIPNSVTSMGSYAFSNCTNLKTVIIGNSVTSIGDRAFNGCKSLISVLIPNSVTYIGSFAFDSSLKDVYYTGSKSNWNNINLEQNNFLTSAYRYYNCILSNEGLCFALNDDENSYSIVGTMEYNNNDILIPSIHNELPVTNIGYRAFANHNSLCTIIIPDSVTCIGDSAFYDCYNLSSLIIPNSVTSIGNFAFAGCDGFSTITIPDSVTSIGDRAFDGCKNLTSVVIPDSVTSIGAYAFSYCISLDFVVIGRGVTTIDAGAFDDCTNLQEVYYTGSKADWSKIRIITYDISDLKNMTKHYDYVYEVEVYSKGLEYTINSDNASYSVTGMGDCTDTDIVIPDTYEGLPVTKIGDKAFEGYSSITSVKIGNNITSIGKDAFQCCRNLTDIVIPDSVTYIGYRSFKECDSITSLSIPDNVTIDYLAFGWCENLNSVTIGNNVTFYGSYVFDYCIKLTSVVIGDGATSIGEHAFNECTSLTHVVIPGSVTSFEPSAFSLCKSLVSITFEGTVAQWNSITKGTSWDYNTGSYIVYCTDGEIS